jgi:hypothetical protein
METSINLSVVSVLLIVVAASSLFVMFSLNNISQIVHSDLYNFGLQFSYRWAMPYWVFSGIVFGLCWASILVSISMTLYLLKRGIKNNMSNHQLHQDQQIKYMESHSEGENQRSLSDYTTEEALSSDESLTPETAEIQPIEYENHQTDDTMQMLVTRDPKDYEEETAPFSNRREGEKKLNSQEEGSSNRVDPCSEGE